MLASVGSFGKDLASKDFKLSVAEFAIFIR
jgi:hypothetical protein